MNEPQHQGVPVADIKAAVLTLEGEAGWERRTTHSCCHYTNWDHDTTQRYIAAAERKRQETSK